jgi:superfamily II DNA or RNA helicase
LTELREDDPTAADIVFADTVTAAEEIGQLLRNQGVTAVVATSDMLEAANLIKEFERSSDPWIVTVRMVSEGVDIALCAARLLQAAAEACTARKFIVAAQKNCAACV